MSIEVGRVDMVLVREATDHGLNKRGFGWESKRPNLTLERKEGIFFFLIDLITRSDPVYRIRHVMVFSKCSCPVILNE